MSKIAVALIAFSFVLTSCSVGSLMSGGNEIVEKTNANYVDYSAEWVKMTEGNKVLFFHASWCGSCKSASKKIAEVQTTSDLTVFKVDYDSNADLRKMYDVTSQHTFVQVDKEGKMLAKWSGSKNIEGIKSNLVESMEKEAMMEDKSDMMNDEKMMDDSEEMSKDEMKKDAMEDSKEIMDDAAEIAEEVVMKKEGKFVAYSAEEVAATSGNKVLFFHASWCPSCTGAAKNLSAETAPEGLNVFKVDYDSNADLKAKYGVVSQHTFVEIDENGTMVNRWFGSRNYTDILAELQS
jgi:thiol-disulfide isomerase/thioredoxin